MYVMDYRVYIMEQFWMTFNHHTINNADGASEDSAGLVGPLAVDVGWNKAVRLLRFLNFVLTKTLKVF